MDVLAPTTAPGDGPPAPSPATRGTTPDSRVPAEVVASVLDAAENMVVITTLEGTIVYVNAAFTTVTGYDREEAIGATPRLLRSGLQDDDFYAELWQTVLAGEVWDGELVNRRRDGSLYTDHMTITPLRGADGELSHLVAVKRDLSTALAELTAASPTGLIHTDVRGRLVFASARACALLGGSFDQLLGSGWLACFTPADRAGLEDAIIDAGRRGGERIVAVRPLDGSILRVHLGAMCDVRGATVGVVASLEDVTKETHALEQLARREAIVRSILDAVDAPTVLVDAAGFITATNAAWDAVQPQPPAGSLSTGVGGSYLEACDRAAAAGCEDAEVVGTELRRVLFGARLPGPIEYELLIDGTPSWWEVRITPAGFEDGGAVLLHTDITWRKQAEALLQHRASHDGLTGLPNRAALVERLERSIAVTGTRPDGPLVLFLDLDGFKPVNDLFGHDAGDEVLRQIAHRMSRIVRPGDMVARLGGDEFVVVCDRLSELGAQALARRLEVTIAEPVELGDGVCASVQASIGTVTARPLEPVEAVLKRADAAMYAAKAVRYGAPPPLRRQDDRPDAAR
jgi:diguanylate cyclase (GGDEF)-like protein/PAS domain S-box-containing protein